MFSNESNATTKWILFSQQFTAAYRSTRSLCTRFPLQKAGVSARSVGYPVVWGGPARCGPPRRSDSYTDVAAPLSADLCALLQNKAANK